MKWDMIIVLYVNFMDTIMTNIPISSQVLSMNEPIF